MRISPYLGDFELFSNRSLITGRASPLNKFAKLPPEPMYVSW